MESTNLSSLRLSRYSNTNYLSTSNLHEPRLPLMEFPPEIRNVIYRHALDNALPNFILPRWMQPLHRYAIDHPVATECPAASSFTNLQLSNRQVYREASYILYQSRIFFFNIAPHHASFLDGCMLSWFCSPNIQDKTYIHGVTNVAIKANWDEHDWAEIGRFPWKRWEYITFILCHVLQGLSWSAKTYLGLGGA